MTFYLLPPVLCSLGLTIFRKSFRSDIRRFFWAWKFWFHRPFPYSFSEHTQWNEVEAIQVGFLLGWTIGRTVMRQRARQKSNRFKFKAKEQLCTCITLFWTLIRLLGTQFKRVRIHLTKSVSWNNRDEGVLKKRQFTFLRDVFPAVAVLWVSSCKSQLRCQNPCSGALCCHRKAILSLSRHL